MSEPASPTSRRSGCALFMGVLLVALGCLFLVQNLFGVSLFGFFRGSLSLFADYWPLVLVVWGAFKIAERFVSPERASVSAFEIFLFLTIVGLGLTVRAAGRFLDQVRNEVSLEEIFGAAGMELIGGPAHRFTDERRFEIGSAASLLVDNATGSVKATAWDEPTVRVVATKRVRHAEESEAARIADAVELTLDRTEETARLAVVLPEESSQVETDLDLYVPRSLSLTIHNRRGRVEVFGFSSPVEIETAEGDVLSSSLSGGLRARTRHGDLRVDRIEGQVELLNRDGAVTARNVRGDLRVETSHDRIVAEDVTGNVVLQNRHAGVRAARIGGDVEVRTENSDVTVETAGGDVTVQSSHRTVFVRGVAGRFTLEGRNATVQASEIRGDASIEDPNGTVTVTDVGGSLRVAARQSRVTVAGIEGAIEIENSQNDVFVTDFGSSLTVRTNHAGVRTDSPRLRGDVNIETTYGEVELRLPESVPLRFEGRTRDGELRAGSAGLDLEETTEGPFRRWAGARGTGGREVKVETTYADILLRTKSTP